MNKEKFIGLIKDGAIKGWNEYGILPSLTIAQAILESGWGSSELSVKANNLFGIKAFSGWRGGRITIPTVEWCDNQKQVINADFRAYDSFNGSIEDHNSLLSYSRYNPVRGCTDYREACRKVYECGYATDPKYAEKLIRIIEENRLYKFDSSILGEEAAIDVSGDKVRRYQKLCNMLGIKDYEGKQLGEDNILGRRTLSCIVKMPLLTIGSCGLAVEFVQSIVGAEPVDGDFGPITQQRVIRFQEKEHIGVDGVVGMETWTAIVVD